MGKASEKYEVIHSIVTSKENILKIADLCNTAGVSRSGYYYWLSTEEYRKLREEKDKKDFDLILEAYKFKGYDKGLRGIHMRLLHLDKPVLMNIKKIRRLMNKYNLRCKIRSANPYRRMAKALKTDSICDNILDRKFKDYGPRKVLLTDITYIPLNDEFSYLSVIKDSYTKQILAYVLSDSLNIDFVLETIKLLINNHGISLDEETLIHSDQGCHYTSKKFRTIINDCKLRQSMSRKGNCWDNAPQESFFGHMKDELGEKIKLCNTYEELKVLIDDWMDYYNNYRYQWELSKLSPNEYYTYVTTGIYPLKIK